MTKTRHNVLFGVIGRVSKNAGKDETLDAINETDNNAVLIGIEKGVIKNALPDGMHQFALQMRQNSGGG